MVHKNGLGWAGIIPPACTLNSQLANPLPAASIPHPTSHIPHPLHPLQVQFYSYSGWYASEQARSGKNQPPCLHAQFTAINPTSTPLPPSLLHPMTLTVYRCIQAGPYTVLIHPPFTILHLRSEGSWPHLIPTFQAIHHSLYSNCSPFHTLLGLFHASPTGSGRKQADSLHLGFNTGTGLPVVFPKWVSRVRVRFWFLADRDTPRTHSTVSRVCTDTLQ